MKNPGLEALRCTGRPDSDSVLISMRFELIQVKFTSLIDRKWEQLEATAEWLDMRLVSKLVAQA